MLPVVVVELPAAEHGVEQAPVAGSAVDVEEADPAVAIGRMCVAAGRLPDAIRIPGGQLLHPRNIHMLVRGENIAGRAAGGVIRQHEPRCREVVLTLSARTVGLWHVCRATT